MEHLLNLFREAGGLVCSQAHPLAGPYTLPLCARCSGIYLAAGFGLLLGLRGSLRREVRGGALLAAIVMILAAPLHVAFFPDSGDLGRFLAGALTGAGVASLVGTRPVVAAGAALALVLLAATRSAAVFIAFAMATPVGFAFSFLIPLRHFAKAPPTISGDCTPKTDF